MTQNILQTFRIKIENHLDLVMSVYPHHFIKILFFLNTFIFIHNNHFNSNETIISKTVYQLSNQKHFAYVSRLKLNKINMQKKHS